MKKIILKDKHLLEMSDRVNAYSNTIEELSYNRHLLRKAFWDAITEKYGLDMTKPYTYSPLDHSIMLMEDEPEEVQKND